MPVPSRAEIAGYAVLLLVVAILGARYMQRQARAGEPAPAAAQRPAGGGAVVVGPRRAGAVVVHVAGAVRRPGVYRLREGARVRDALRRAGGATGGAAVDAINLAARLADAQQVVVPEDRPPATPGAAGAGPPSEGPVSLSTATVDQLDALDGVGPALAQRIVAARAERGGFASVDDLADVPGIGPKRLEALRAAVAP